jgi:crotonobetainyl-CoA:carnitine CoA-transferase CaiB-like acyl-CoA transferase
MLPGLLAGIRVLDLSQYVPGPYAARLLAECGAEVAKIEPPDGDPARQLAPLDDDGLSPLWKAMNAGKTVVALDLKSAEGASVFAELLPRADVLIESYRPGVLGRLGFSRERLMALNPKLIHAALSGYGQTGPWRLRTGHDVNYMATAGALALSGTADRPVMAFPPTADFASSIQTALAVCAALVRRGRSGEGAFLDLSLTETVLAWQHPWLAMAAKEPRDGRATMMLNGGAAYYNIYRTRDGRFVTLGAIEAKFWANFCAAVGHTDWIARQTEPLPQHMLIEAVAALFATRSAAQWEELLGPVDCCFAIVLDAGEVAAHPQIAARAQTGGLGLLHVEDAGTILARWTR